MNNESEIKKAWKSRGFSFGIWIDLPGQVWSDFTHEMDELFMLVDGEVELIVDGKTMRPEVGQEILIPANQVHTVKNIGGTASHWFYGYKKG